MSNRQKPNGPVLVTSPSKSNTTELVRDFLVDGLGILLPGLGFVFACIPAALIPLAWLILMIDVRLSSNPAAGDRLVHGAGNVADPGAAATSASSEPVVRLAE